MFCQGLSGIGVDVRGAFIGVAVVILAFMAVFHLEFYGIIHPGKPEMCS